METVICCVFFSVFDSLQIQTTKRKRVNTPIFAKKLPKRLSIFYRACNKNREHKYSRSEFYYPEDLIQRQSGIGERQDDFIKKQKRANTNKKMATDLNTLLHYV